MKIMLGSMEILVGEIKHVSLLFECFNLQV